LSFALAFLLVSGGIVMFSMAGDVYRPVMEGQGGMIFESDDAETRASGEAREQDVESQRLLASALATLGQTPVGLGPREVDGLQQEGPDRKLKLADVELECRDA